MVDNHHMNPFMMAAGGGNVFFVKHFFNRVPDFSARGFLWDQENKNHRNARSIVCQQGSNKEIRKMLDSLANKKLLTVQVFPTDPARPDKQGGTSSANSRHRASSQPIIQTRGGVDWEHRAVPCVANANEPPPCVANAGGSASSGSNEQRGGSSGSRNRFRR